MAGTVVEYLPTMQQHQHGKINEDLKEQKTMEKLRTYTNMCHCVEFTIKQDIASLFGLVLSIWNVSNALEDHCISMCFFREDLLLKLIRIHFFI